MDSNWKRWAITILQIAGAVIAVYGIIRLFQYLPEVLKIPGK